MSLTLFWFVAIAVLWTGFIVLEGFDFGVGMLHRFVGHTETERRVLVNAIGPFWDGNEVWLIVAGAGTFAAFPGWYATWFSAGYLALVLVLLALMVRGVSFEFRGHRDTNRWRAWWSWLLTAGSGLVPLLLGVALGDLLAGLPVDDNQEFTGNFWDLLTPYGVYVGVTLVVLCVLHGASFLTLRTLDGLRERAHRVAWVTSWPALLLVAGFGVWTSAISDQGFWWETGPLVLAFVAAFLASGSLHRRAEGPAFVGTAATIGLTVLSLFTNLYPNVLVSSTSASNSLTVSNTASGHYSLQVMTVVAVVFLPLVMLYQGWTFYVFRRRLALPPAGTDQSAPTKQGAPV